MDHVRARTSGEADIEEDSIECPTPLPTEDSTTTSNPTATTQPATCIGRGTGPVSNIPPRRSPRDLPPPGFYRPGLFPIQ